MQANVKIYLPTGEAKLFTAARRDYRMAGVDIGGEKIDGGERRPQSLGGLEKLHRGDRPNMGYSRLRGGAGILPRSGAAAHAHGR